MVWVVGGAKSIGNVLGITKCLGQLDIYTPTKSIPRQLDCYARRKYMERGTCRP
jgi:hypothetical protein